MPDPYRDRAPPRPVHTSTFLSSHQFIGEACVSHHFYVLTTKWDNALGERQNEIAVRVSFDAFS